MKRIFLLFFLLLTPLLGAKESPYAHMGINNQLGETNKGKGRYYRGNSAIDFSSKGIPTQPETKKDFNKRNQVKTMVLLYPDVEAQNRIYFGGGVSGGLGANSGKVFKRTSTEGIIGYEIRNTQKKTKIYTQLEASQALDERRPELTARLGFNF